MSLHNYNTHAYELITCKRRSESHVKIPSVVSNKSSLVDSGLIQWMIIVSWINNMDDKVNPPKIRFWRSCMQRTSLLITCKNIPKLTCTKGKEHHELNNITNCPPIVVYTTNSRSFFYSLKQSKSNCQHHSIFPSMYIPLSCNSVS